MSTVYTYSEARQNLATVLEEASRAGEVRIKRRDGRVFVIRPESNLRSPLDVPGVATDLNADEIEGFVQAGRRPAE